MKIQNYTKKRLTYPQWVKSNSSILTELYAEFLKDIGAVSILLCGKEVPDFKAFCLVMFGETVYAGKGSK